jgi:intracellular multiplication protein IcmK
MMKKTILVAALSFSTLLTVSSYAQAPANPLDRFRSDNNQGQQAQQQGQQAPQQTQQQDGGMGFLPRAQGIGNNSNALPSPTIGGLQQQGLTEAEINEALQNYNFGDGMTFEERRAEVERQSRRAAFEATLNGALPLTPDEILELLDRFRDVREASESRIGGPPNASITLEPVSLDPGVTPPIIKLSPGHVTTLNILDITGQPWPIQDISWGGDFEVIEPLEGEHVVRISPMKAHEVGNLSIQLLELDTPVVFSLRTSLDEVQYRFDAQIPEMGPYSETPIIDNFDIRAAAGDDQIIRILNGTPPATAEKLDVEGVDRRTSAYDVNGQIYVRTPLSMLSPGWNSSITSADGTTVYQIGRSPVLLLSDKGKMVRARINYN